MNFEDALAHAKAGRTILRKGWNGPNQWVKAQFPDADSMMSVPYLYLRNSDGHLVPWVPSQGDLFATDWVAYASKES